MIFLLLNGSESEHEGICNFRVAEPATREEEESKGWYSKLFDLTNYDIYEYMYHKVSMVGRRWAPSSTQVPHQRFLQVKFIYFSSICDSCIQYIIYICRCII